jgi:hypothetical protein
VLEKVSVFTWFREEITFFFLSLDSMKIEKKEVMKVQFRSRWKAMTGRSERMWVT